MRPEDYETMEQMLFVINVAVWAWVMWSIWHGFTHG